MGYKVRRLDTGDVDEMLSSSEAADELGVTSVRIRELLDEGRLDGFRASRSRYVWRSSVERRKAEAPGAGRPKGAAVPASAAPDVSQDAFEAVAHGLYEQCEGMFAGRYDVRLLQSACDGRERRFFAHVSDFFLQERQRELVEEGASSVFGSV